MMWLVGWLVLPFSVAALRRPSVQSPPLSFLRCLYVLCGVDDNQRWITWDGMVWPAATEREEVCFIGRRRHQQHHRLFWGVMDRCVDR